MRDKLLLYGKRRHDMMWVLRYLNIISSAEIIKVENRYNNVKYSIQSKIFKDEPGYAVVALRRSSEH